MSPPAPGHLLAGRYRLDDRIARGGMATVWLGRDDLLGRRVAVKTLHPELSHDAALRSRFRQEAVAAAALSHPNIVATYDTGEDDETAFIVMELVEGESLRQLLDRVRVLDPPQATAIAHQVAMALDHAHKQGVIHRDIKPANVLVPREGAVKVADFGIAKAAGGDDHTRTGTVVGTARYLSPEQVQGLPADARTDVYALGLVLYEMLAGRPAFSGDTEMATALARLTGPPPSLAATRPGIPPALAGVVEAALQPEAAHRIPTAADFDQALHR
ncbi:MAG: serine/threonine protein kinase, partial [Actinobacteria bacterium]|nr:serine/threonine protein kinase [Actinomycetota bacterium]